MDFARVGLIAMTIRVLLVVLAFLLVGVEIDAQPPVLVMPDFETQPTPNAGDSADDPAIWIHPTHPEQGTIIGTDKMGGIAVYDLDGSQIQYLSLGTINNIDVRYDFPLNHQPTDIVAATKSDTDTLVIFRVNPETRELVDVAARIIPTNIAPLKGLCMYRSRATDNYYVFVTTYERGDVQQWLLFDNGSGQIDAELVRSFTLGSNVEGCVADDALGHVYLAEEEVGIWKLGAEPSAGENRELVDTTNGSGYLAPEVEGLALYMTSETDGYLIASSQGNDQFNVYGRALNDYLGSFQVAHGEAADEVTHTDGISVTSAPMGSRFPAGLFIAQDHLNTDPDANQNFKVVSWNDIAQSLQLPQNAQWNPRLSSSLE